MCGLQVGGVGRESASQCLMEGVVLWGLWPCEPCTLRLEMCAREEGGFAGQGRAEPNAS